MNPRLLSGIALSMFSLVIGAPAAAYAVAPRQHPAYTDPAGDAQVGTGIFRANVPAADIVSGDVTVDANTLTFTTTAAGPRKLLANSDTFYASAGTDQNSVTSIANDASSSANLVIAYGGLDVAGISVAGTATLDRATHTLTARYPLAAVNAAEQQEAQDPDHGLPAIVFAPDLLVHAGVVSQVGTSSTSPAVDFASSASLFTLGG